MTKAMRTTIIVALGAIISGCAIGDGTEITATGPQGTSITIKAPKQSHPTTAPTQKTPENGTGEKAESVHATSGNVAALAIALVVGGMSTFALLKRK